MTAAIFDLVAPNPDTQLLAIDPGNQESAYVILDTHDRRPVQFAKLDNLDLLHMLTEQGRQRELCQTPLPPVAAVEMVASYGMPVGAEVFETCVWIGRYQQVLEDQGTSVHLVKRHPIKLHHCHDSKAKDSNITQALVDRFAYGQTNHGKGTKAHPGWFHGFHRDIWQAYALGVYAADTLTGNQLDPAANDAPAPF